MRLNLMEQLMKAKKSENPNLTVDNVDHSEIGLEVHRFLNSSNVNENAYEDLDDVQGARKRPKFRRKRTTDDDEEQRRKAQEFAEKMEQERLKKRQKEANKRKRLREKMKADEEKLQKIQEER